jgi:hypothetical protein
VEVKVFAPVTPAVFPAPVPAEVMVLPVASVVLEVNPGNFEVVPAAVVPAVFAPAIAPVVLPAAVEPFRADVTAFLG